MGELSAGEIEKLKGYETKNKNRHSPLERFHRSLVCSNGRVRRHESALYRHADDSAVQDPRRDGGPPELMRISLQAGDEQVLPVFSFEMLTRGFVRCGDLGLEWRVRESHTGELVSLLLGPYADVMRILPNPLPKPLAAEDALLNLLLRGRSLSITLARGQVRLSASRTG